MGNRRALARRTAFALLTLPALTSLTSIASRSAPPVVITGLQPVGLIESEIAVPSDATAPADQLPATIDSLPGAAVDGAAGGSSQAVRAVMQSLVRKDYQRALREVLPLLDASTAPVRSVVGVPRFATGVTGR